MAAHENTPAYQADQPKQIREGSRQKAPTKLGIRQVLYVLIVQGVGALIIAGGANFGIAYGMYRHSPRPVKLWDINDNTLAGDAGVTVIVEVIVSWIISAAMVCNDVRTAALGLAPVASSLGMAQSTGKASLGRRVLEGFVSVENMDLLAPRLSLWQRAVRLIRSAFCGFLACIPVFFLWWPIGVGSLTGPGQSIGHHEYEFNHYPAPQVFKLIYGGSMGLLTVPLVALLAMIAMGRRDLAASNPPTAAANGTLDNHQGLAESDLAAV